jgi:hypothetical protein
LSVKKEWRSKSHEIYVPILLFAFRYCQTKNGVDYLVSVSNVKGGIVMRALFGFEPLGESVQKCSYAGNKRSTAQVLNSSLVRSFLKNNFKSNDICKNLYKLFYDSPWESQWDIKDKKYPLVSEPILSRSDFFYFFNQQSSWLGSLTRKEQQIFKNFYYKKYDNYLGGTFSDNTRNGIRYSVHMKVSIRVGDKLVQGKALDLSLGGIQLLLSEHCESSSLAQISGVIYLNNTDRCSFTGKTFWIHNNRIGLKFIAVDRDKIVEFALYAYSYLYEQDPYKIKKAS